LWQDSGVASADADEDRFDRDLLLEEGQRLVDLERVQSTEFDVVTCDGDGSEHFSGPKPPNRAEQREDRERQSGDRDERVADAW
jgi:hypothetical protein